MALASGSEQFRVPKTSSEETGLVNDTVPPSTKYNNKWAVNIFAEWHSLREVKVPVLERYPTKSVYGIICSLKRHLEM